MIVVRHNVVGLKLMTSIIVEIMRNERAPIFFSSADKCSFIDSLFIFAQHLEEKK